MQEWLMYTASVPEDRRLRKTGGERSAAGLHKRFDFRRNIPMVIKVKFESLADIEALQELANSVKDPVYLTSGEEKLLVDARTFLGLFSLDFSKPVKVVTDSLYVIRRLEHAARAGEAKVG